MRRIDFCINSLVIIKPISLVGLHIFLTLLVLTSHAQDFSFVKFGQNEGLNHSQIISISQDQTGNLWLGTVTRSIYRFDGKSFSEYKIYVDGYTGTLYTFRVQVDKKGGIWILSNIGLIFFNGKESKVIPTSGNMILGTQVDLILDLKDNLWVIDGKGDVFTIKEDTLRLKQDIQQALPNIMGNYTNELGMVCFYSANGKLLTVSKNEEIVLSKGPWATKKNIHTIYSAGSNSYIIGSANGIERFSSSGSRKIPITGMSGSDFITKVFVDKQGWIWGIMSGRVFMIDQNNALHWIADSSELKNDALFLFQDKDKSIWISIDVIGIVKYKQHAWKKISSTTGIDITTIAEKPDRSGLIFGTYNEGILGFGKPILKNNPISTIYYDNTGRLLAGALKKGLFSVENSVPQIVFPTSESYMDVNGIAQHGDSLILATQEGLYIIPNSTKPKLFSKKVQGYSLPVSNPIIINDSVYVAGMVSGVLKLSGDSLVEVGPQRLHKSTVYGIRKLPWNDYIVTGEFAELLFFDSTFTFKKSIDLRAIVSNVLLLEFLDQEHILVGSNDGLFKIAIGKDSVKQVKKYGKIDGFEGEELYVGASLSATDKSIFIGTVNGAYQYQEKNELYDLSPPSTYLTQVLFRTANLVDSLAGYFRLPVSPELKHNENYITFYFSSTSLSNPYNTTFSYKMEGLDEDWSAPSAARIVSYSNLAPGNYKFKVQSISENNTMGTIAEYSFIVKPAFWQTSMFYGVMLIAAAITTLTVIQVATTRGVRRLRLKEELRAQESIRLKKQMSMDFHDEMGNRLANMLTRASLLKVRYHEGELHSIFNFFELHAHAIYHGTKDFIWSIDIDSNNLKEVISYLRDFGADYFEKNGIKFHVQTEILSDQFNVLMPDGYNRNIILVMKEAMTNILKHAQAKNIYFNAHTRGETFEIALKDDGTGFSDSGNGNGLKNMKSRAAKINATLTINSKKHEGTLITLSFSVKKQYEKF